MLQPQQLNDLPIDDNVIEHVPESVARDLCVLPVSFVDDHLHLILPATIADDGDSTLETLRFVLAKDFTYDVAPRDELARIVDIHYSAAYSKIDNCAVRFRFQCPKRWAELQPTPEKLVRHCDVCDKDVFHCNTRVELQIRASNNQCVAFRAGNSTDSTLGLVVPH